MFEGIEAVLFDLDGTLLDSLWVWEAIDVAFLSERNIPIPETLQQDIGGKSFLETAEFFIEQFDLTLTPQELMDSWNRAAFARYAEEVPVKEGVMEFVAALKAAEIRMGIATSNSKVLTDVALQRVGLDRYIEEVVTADMVPKGKPEPDVYLELAKRLGVSPEHCLVFEDIPEGIMAGNRAGMRTCGVFDRHSAGANETLRALAKFYIPDFEQVLKRMGEHYAGN